jgi:hypothetical protein
MAGRETEVVRPGFSLAESRQQYPLSWNANK